MVSRLANYVFFFFQAEDGIRDADVTGVQTCALPIYATRAVVALCAAHPGPAPVLVEWEPHPPAPSSRSGEGERGGEGGNGGSAVRLRSRSLRVDPADDLVVALRALLRPDHVHLVRTT